MSTITVNSVDGRHRFEDVDRVEMRDAGELQVIADPEGGTPVVRGAFAGGHWSSWIRQADEPSAPAHRTHVHLADRAADLIE